jgi:hypothetical protein
VLKKQLLGRSALLDCDDNSKSHPHGATLVRFVAATRNTTSGKRKFVVVFEISVVSLYLFVELLLEEARARAGVAV